MNYRTETRINEDGRILIPAFYRKRLGIQAGDELKIDFDGGRIVIEPKTEGCLICGDAVNRSALSRQLGICPGCFRKELNIDGAGGRVKH